MTLDDRLKAMAEAYYDRPLPESGDVRRSHLHQMRWLAEKFAPELFSVPPTGWIAPWMPDREMVEAEVDYLNFADWEAVRDDWLSRHPMKPTEAKE